MTFIVRKSDYLKRKRRTTYRLERSQRCNTSRIRARNFKAGELQSEAHDRRMHMHLPLRGRRRLRQPAEMREDAQPAHVVRERRLRRVLRLSRRALGRAVCPGWRLARWCWPATWGGRASGRRRRRCCSWRLGLRFRAFRRCSSSLRRALRLLQLAPLGLRHLFCVLLPCCGCAADGVAISFGLLCRC